MKLVILLSLVATMFLSSCAVTLPVAATSNPIGSKVGSAKTTRILGLFFFDGGDAGIQKAAKNGGITKVATVDFKTNLVFLSLVISHETIVTGE